MVPDDFTDFFVAADGVAGALIGLLFVAVSLAPRRLRGGTTAHVAQAQASAALLVFTNTLALGLIALFPGTGLATPALVIGGLALIYAGSVARVAFARAPIDRSAAGQLRRIAVGTFAVAGFEIYGGIELTIHRTDSSGVYTLASVMVAALLFGISRAWELVGLQGTGLFHSLAVLRHPEEAVSTDGPEEAVEREAQ